MREISRIFLIRRYPDPDRVCLGKGDVFVICLFNSTISPRDLSACLNFWGGGGGVGFLGDFYNLGSMSIGAVQSSSKGILPVGSGYVSTVQHPFDAIEVSAMRGIV